MSSEGPSEVLMLDGEPDAPGSRNGGPEIRAPRIRFGLRVTGRARGHNASLLCAEAIVKDRVICPCVYQSSRTHPPSSFLIPPSRAVPSCSLDFYFSPHFLPKFTYLSSTHDGHPTRTFHVNRRRAVLLFF
jgi:hypothetical protein